MNLLMCPVCREALTLNERTWRCANSHSYDVAKQGYVNLHVVQHKHSKNPGDTPESVQARRAFLSAGHYAPLQQAVVNRVRELRIENLLDIGCGEGYYTDAMQAEVLQCIGDDRGVQCVPGLLPCWPVTVQCTGTQGLYNLHGGGGLSGRGCG